MRKQPQLGKCNRDLEGGLEGQKASGKGRILHEAVKEGLDSGWWSR